MCDEFTKDMNHLLIYMITSASGCVNEPKLYGSMRLADAASKLIVLLNKYDVPLNDKLNQVEERIGQDKLLCMDDEKGFVKMLNDISLMMTDVLLEEDLQL